MTQIYNNKMRKLISARNVMIVRENHDNIPVFVHFTS